MEDVVFKNMRFDPDLTPFHGIAKEMAKSVGYTAKLALDPILAQMLRLRVAQIYQCSYCLILHTKTLHEMDIPDFKIAHLSAWRESHLFSEQEAAALNYCEKLSSGESENFSSVHKDLAKCFNKQEVAEIAAVVINMNLWTRLKLAQGATPALK